YKRSACLLRALRRNARYLFRSRPGLPARCPEISILPTLLKIIWQFPSRARPKILKFRNRDDKTFVHIRNNTELSLFLRSVGATWLNKAHGPAS
ncbi:MAG TPA: hypothetical protein VNE18_09065, partial [Rhodanobacter sp.]|nr:hypothetical protein [Rhodanobacter sp.]